jgi:Protein of unknown function (DUF3016)
MRSAITKSLATGCLAGAAALSTHAAGAIDVTFVQPESFADAGLPGWSRERTLRRLADEFQQLAKKLPDGQSMTVEVLDVDLAGDLDPTRGGLDQRVLRGKSDWPRIHLRYTLAAGGKPLKNGDEWIADLLYLDQRARLPDTRDLAYERRMLEDWFGERILGAAATK